MSRDFRIKQLQSAKLSDAQLTRLAQLWQQLDAAENSYDGKHGLEMVPSTEEGCRAFIQKADRGITAAVDKDDQILGFATNMPAREYKNVNYISALTVDENNRGKGIGRAILQNILRRNRSQKRKSMLRVSLNNPAGLHLYGSLGFKPVSQTMLLGEKSASSKADIAQIYDSVKKRYTDMGYPVSGDRLCISAQPTYTNGRPVPKGVMRPNESGGNVQDDGTIRINPNYRAVMRHWKLKGSGSDFLRTIIGHELGHHIDRTILSTPERSAERRRLLKEIVRAKFHTVYTDSYGPDTDSRKLDKELLAEYLASKAVGKE